MSHTTYAVKTVFPAIWILIAVVGAAIRTRHSPSREAALETWQRWWAVAALGCGSLYICISFLVGQQSMADAIGFTRSPFQFEIAFANLALVVMALRVARPGTTPRERVTVGLGAGVFLWGAAFGHVYQWFANHDHQPGNTGGVLAADVLFPAVMIALAWRAQRLGVGGAGARAEAGAGQVAEFGGERHAASS
ncbi:hypothetical protein KGQ20_25355 [Catenulispora sp. NF23]|uniref:Integral membrane protein n=1 Tax=Catenulispora pinistramenti TaxID=2705254 RepID=A0ABS5KWG5_9ACTN|nr:DUF6790 family protein [Catenulispora pinistramenti]MBS2536095.1 hypothetical protein [Catenulispora pinistramenti]MBS2550305.1 hypothetical protein [Catenulispora pinistramenti]